MTSHTLDKDTLYIIFYFIERLDGVLGKTHLQKLLFLTDLLAVRKFKKKLTKIDYKKYLHGPYSEVVDEYTAHLAEKGAIEEKKFPVSTGVGFYSRYHKKKQGSIKSNLVANLGAEKVLLIDDVVNSFGNMSLQQVLDVVYKLEIVKDAKKNTPLDVAKEIDLSSEGQTDNGITL